MTIIDPHQFLMNLFPQGIPDNTTLILEYEESAGKLHIIRCDTVDEASEEASRLIQEGYTDRPVFKSLFFCTLRQASVLSFCLKEGHHL